jgi:HSP20 family protein
MAESATKLPIKTETSAAPAQQAGWGALGGLKREIDRLFDDFHPFGWRLPSARSAFDFELPRLSGGGWPIAPAIDLAEKETEYEITAELPGLEQKDIEVKLSNQTLTISGEKKEEREEKRKDYHLSERRYGSFRRSLQLPEGVDTDKVDATFAKGVLTIKLPKTAEAQKAEKSIAIKAA